MMTAMRPFCVVAGILALGSAGPARAGDLGHAIDYLQKKAPSEATEGYRHLAKEEKHEALRMIVARDTVEGMPLDAYRCSDTHLDSFTMRSKGIDRWGHYQCLIRRFALDELPDFVTLGPPRLEPETVKAMIAPIARKTGVPPYLLETIVMFRSGYRPSPVAKSGHVGIMGLHPDHLRQVGLPTDGLLNPRRNLMLGARYLRKLAFEVGGSYKKALFAYPIGLRAYEAGTRPSKDDVAFVRGVLTLFYSSFRPFPTDAGVRSMVEVLTAY